MILQLIIRPSIGKPRMKHVKMGRQTDGQTDRPNNRLGQIGTRASWQKKIEKCLTSKNSEVPIHSGKGPSTVVLVRPDFPRLTGLTLFKRFLHFHNLHSHTAWRPK